MMQVHYWVHGQLVAHQEVNIKKNDNEGFKPCIDLTHSHRVT